MLFKFEFFAYHNNCFLALISQKSDNDLGENTKLILTDQKIIDFFNKK